MADDTSMRSQRPEGIAELLAKLDRQIEQDHFASAQHDGVAETVADLLVMLPYATPSDTKLAKALPAHFIERAHEKEASGHRDEANRFAALASVLEGILNPQDTTAPGTAQAGLPNASVSGSSAIAAIPASPPADAAGDRDIPIGDAGVVAMISRPSQDTSVGQASAKPTGPGLGNLSDRAATGGETAAGAPYSQMSDPATTRPQSAPPIPILLANLDKQIMADPASPESATVGNTITELLVLLPNAPQSDLKSVLALPAHYVSLAREAAASGQLDQASRLAALGGILKDVLDAMIPKNGVARVVPWPAEPPAMDGRSPAILETPETSSIAHDAPISGNQDAAITTGPNTVTSAVRPQAGLAERAGGDRPGQASANVAANGGANGQPIPPPLRQSQKVVSLFALLDKEIAANPPGKAQDKKIAETIAEILVMLRDAPPSDLRIVLAMPGHFANRARQAEAGGRYDEANSYTMLAGLLEDLFHGRTAEPAQRSPQHPATEQSSVKADADALSGPAFHSLDRTSGSDGNDGHGDFASTPSSTGTTGIRRGPSAELADRAGDRSGIGSPVAAKLAPPEASRSGESRLVSDERQTQRGPEVRVASRDMPIMPGIDGRPPLGELLVFPNRPASPREGNKIATAQTSPLPRVTAPTSTRVTTSTANTLNPQCRAIVLKFQIGEEPSDAERNLLRHGCRQHG